MYWLTSCGLKEDRVFKSNSTCCWTLEILDKFKQKGAFECPFFQVDDPLYYLRCESVLAVKKTIKDCLRYTVWIGWGHRMEFDLPRTRTRESLQFEVVTIFDDSNCSQSMPWSPIFKEKGEKIKEENVKCHISLYCVQLHSNLLAHCTHQSVLEGLTQLLRACKPRQQHFALADLEAPHNNAAPAPPLQVILI